jgi:Domain of unknown function (DUF3883)
LERYSRDVVIDLLKERYAGCRVDAMPTNYPGFDLLTDVAELRYVEVKATQAPVLRFLDSEGGRRFASQNDGEYTLVVVYGVDLEATSYVGVAWWRGALGSETGLEPTHWAGQLQEGTGRSLGGGGGR